MLADCEDVSSRDLITNDIVFRTEYESRRSIQLSVCEVPTQIVGEHLASYIYQFGQIISASYDELPEGWNHHFTVEFAMCPITIKVLFSHTSRW